MQSFCFLSTSQKKVSRFLEMAKDKKGVLDLRRRQRKPLNFHEDQLHKFDK